MRKAAAALGTIVLGTSTMLGVATVWAPAAQARTSPVVIHEIFYNSPGSDNGSNRSLNGEWVQLHNRTSRRITLTGWRLRDLAGHVYKFGTYRIKAGGYVKIHTGRGTNTQTNRYWGRRAYVWNNDTDRATLKNASGVVKDRCSYNNPNRSFKIC
jgi:Lamin Tail Domain